jgi:hypothetical protein
MWPRSPLPASSSSSPGTCSPGIRSTRSPRPSLVREKVRRLELLCGAERHRGKRTGVFAERAQHHLEKELATQAEIAYQRLVKDWAPGRRTVREPQAGRASSRR